MNPLGKDLDATGGGSDVPKPKPTVKKGGWASGIIKPASMAKTAPPPSRLDTSPPNTKATWGGAKDNSHGSHSFGRGANDAGGDDACRYCHKPGHFARECPEKPANDGGCFNCGETGHNKMECPNPRKFSGQCHNCGKEGHSSRECPESICSKCQQKGHARKECTGSQVVFFNGTATRDSNEAWEDVVKASQQDDIDDFKKHMLEYLKSQPKLTFADLERSFRAQNLNFYLHALTVDEVTYSKIIIGPNGATDCKYVWSLGRSVKPRRSKALLSRMASTIEENLIRLEKAGFLEDYQGDFCRKCKTKDHTTTDCKADFETENMEGLSKVGVKCTNCDALTHRLRDCPEPRKAQYNPNVCRNCQQEGHRSADCENPRVAGPDTECRKCNKKGHFGSNCPDAPKQVCFNCYQEGHRSSDCVNEKVIKCRNCDELGHVGRDCKKPRDMTRVKCTNCEKFGHFPSVCPNPAKSAETSPDGKVPWGAKTKSVSPEPIKGAKTPSPELKAPKTVKKAGNWATKTKKLSTAPTGW